MSLVIYSKHDKSMTILIAFSDKHHVWCFSVEVDLRLEKGNCLYLEEDVKSRFYEIC
jgi:hypothetical protein